MKGPEITDYSEFLQKLKKSGDHRYPEADFQVDRFLGLLEYKHPFAYARFNDGTYDWYSELFRVVDSGEDTEESDYRIWSTERHAFRIWEDSDDLRITR